MRVFFGNLIIVAGAVVICYSFWHHWKLELDFAQTRLALLLYAGGIAIRGL